MTRGVHSADVVNGRVGGRTTVYNKYIYPKREEPLTLTLEELRSEHERVVMPVLRAADDGSGGLGS